MPPINALLFLPGFQALTGFRKYRFFHPAQTEENTIRLSGVNMTNISRLFL
jgi:hypothetical protein